MWCDELAIQQGEVADPQPGDQPGQSDLRRVGHPAEHGLPEEGTAELYAIEAADKLALVPAFDRVGVANGVEAQCRPLDDGVDPGFRAIGAGEQHVVKSLVASNREAVRPDPLGQRMRHVKIVEWNDGPAARFHPEDVASIAAVGHGEYAGGISPKQHPRIEALAHSS